MKHLLELAVWMNYEAVIAGHVTFLSYSISKQKSRQYFLFHRFDCLLDGLSQLFTNLRDSMKIFNKAINKAKSET
ncbi:CLUMA_CG021514, isoform A [Clunio marinus]|uniref:CLUMA_CG021514, isoform A n=1 Tax=Clunio marinus TaxID=568069 RepID=A0A1J1J8W9_9DIPT|nr:CLUMA_CG021514, isoform A [Clunio marinus]